MSYYFDNNEKETLLEIKNKIYAGTGLEEILLLCSKAGDFKDNFPLLYAAILLASNKRKNDALLIYDSGKLKHPFTDEFFRFLKKTGSIEPKVVVFKSSLPYDSWVKTNLFRIELEDSLKVAREYYKASILPDGEINILDIGPGNGKMTASIVNKILENKRIKKVRLVLLDKFPSMLESSSEYCKKNIKAETTVQTICFPAQELGDEEMAKLKKYTPFSLAICSRSIHHMPFVLKEVLLKKLRELTASLFLVEMNSTHDLPEKEDPDLIYSIAKSYGFTFNDIRNSPLTEEEMLAAIDDFLLAEALIMIGKERLERIDYHATIKEWSTLAENAHFKVAKVQSSACYADGEAHYFTMIMSH